MAEPAGGASSGHGLERLWPLRLDPRLGDSGPPGPSGASAGLGTRKELGFITDLILRIS